MVCIFQSYITTRSVLVSRKNKHDLKFFFPEKMFLKSNEFALLKVKLLQISPFAKPTGFGSAYSTLKDKIKTTAGQVAPWLGL